MYDGENPKLVVYGNLKGQEEERDEKGFQEGTDLCILNVEVQEIQSQYCKVFII